MTYAFASHCVQLIEEPTRAIDGSEAATPGAGCEIIAVVAGVTIHTLFSVRIHNQISVSFVVLIDTRLVNHKKRMKEARQGGILEHSIQGVCLNLGGSK